MSKEYKLKYEDKFHITNHGDSITVRWKDNDCENIKEGDVITELVRIRDDETDTQIYEVIGVSPFMKSFGIKGDLLSIIIKPKQKKMSKEQEIMSTNFVDRKNDEEIIDLINSILSNGKMQVETINEAVLVKLMEIRNTPIKYDKSYRDIDKDFERWQNER